MMDESANGLNIRVKKCGQKCAHIGGRGAGQPGLASPAARRTPIIRNALTNSFLGGDASGQQRDVSHTSSISSATAGTGSGSSAIVKIEKSDENSKVVNMSEPLSFAHQYSNPLMDVEYGAMLAWVKTQMVWKSPIPAGLRGMHTRFPVPINMCGLSVVPEWPFGLGVQSMIDIAVDNTVCFYTGICSAARPEVLTNYTMAASVHGVRSTSFYVDASNFRSLGALVRHFDSSLCC